MCTSLKNITPPPPPGLVMVVKIVSPVMIEFRFLLQTLFCIIISRKKLYMNFLKIMIKTIDCGLVPLSKVYLNTNIYYNEGQYYHTKLHKIHKYPYIS